MRRWRDDGLDVCAYFDNDVKVHAPYDAAALRVRLGLPSGLGDVRRPPPKERSAAARAEPRERWPVRGGRS